MTGLLRQSTFWRLGGYEDVNDAERVGVAVRSRWGIENRLHWALDVTMNDDQTTNRKDNGAQNLALRRRLVLNLARLGPSRAPSFCLISPAFPSRLRFMSSYTHIIKGVAKFLTNFVENKNLERNANKPAKISRTFLH